MPPAQAAFYGALGVIGTALLALPLVERLAQARRRGV